MSMRSIAAGQIHNSDDEHLIHDGHYLELPRTHTSLHRSSCCSMIP